MSSFYIPVTSVAYRVQWPLQLLYLLRQGVRGEGSPLSSGLIPVSIPSAPRSSLRSLVRAVFQPHSKFLRVWGKQASFYDIVIRSTESERHGKVLVWATVFIFVAY